MVKDKELMRHYNVVRPIVFRLRRLYHIKLWEVNDWEQEGLICLYHLLKAQPQLRANQSDLRRYFKTKFSNYIKDCIRRQTSLKRRFNAMAYEEVSELGHLIPSKEMLVDDYVAFCDSLAKLKRGLSAVEQAQLDQLMLGACFKGRKALIRKIQGISLKQEGLFG